MADAIPVHKEPVKPTIPSEPPKAVDEDFVKSLHKDMQGLAREALKAGKQVFVLPNGSVRIDH